MELAIEEREGEEEEEGEIKKEGGSVKSIDLGLIKIGFNLLSVLIIDSDSFVSLDDIIEDEFEFDLGIKEGNNFVEVVEIVVEVVDSGNKIKFVSIEVERSILISGVEFILIIFLLLLLLLLGKLLVIISLL